MMRQAAVAALLVLALAAPSLVAAQQYDSIVDAAKAKDLKLFLKMADATGFTPQLESPGFIGTVFAPTDDAVETALATAGTTMDQLLRNNSLAVDVIMYHVIPGQSVSSDNLQHDGTYTSMRGKPLTITKSLGGDVAVNSGSTAAVIDPDIKAGAATFNVVDNMLVPPDELASLNLKQADAVKFYTTIDEATGYDDSLSTVYNAIQDSGLSAYAGDPKTVATLFAPTDDAWDTVTTMSTYYTGNESAITGNKKALTNLLKYHIVPDRALRASQLKDKTTLKMSNGETVMIHVTDKAARKASTPKETLVREAGSVVASKISGVEPGMHILLTPNTDGDEATVNTANIIAGRSYVHKVDAVLIPKSTLKYLESFTADSGKKKKNATVTEAFSGNATDVGATNATETKAAKAPKATAAKNETAAGKAAAGNTTDAAPAPAKSSASKLAAAALLGAPALLAMLLL